MKKELQNNPIGVFDSGVGGLTVVKELAKILPNENIIYFGDTARVPYGTKSKDAVIRFSNEIVGFLMDRKVKLILVACNTASAMALNEISKKVDVKTVGVIESGVFAAISASKRKKIGVIGTEATIKSGAYEKNIKRFDKNIKVINHACPLFVPLAEEGWINNQASKIIAVEYLKSIKNSGADTVILGCTHYPLLKKVIYEVLGRKIKLIDSASEVAKKVKNILEEENLINPSNKKGRKEFFVSDAPQKFKKLGEMFLNEKIVTVTKVNIEGKYV
ncbi:MAG: glutamate racemase [Elusimicrobia bacterium RIFOXYC2_FULL_34_12]|nr:MAG: glutamate racemase [Elusimicrobia bacterium RIFOXYC2_FULL_34_12]OGS39090.1 MAG: glutamate racemase [Elusimicrobia bacterium RIFOXYD2_FULL_34_30]HAM39633.1 glutamate racemase [Elusimicrobiota bacterium]